MWHLSEMVEVEVFAGFPGAQPGWYETQRKPLCGAKGGKTWKKRFTLGPEVEFCPKCLATKGIAPADAGFLVGASEVLIAEPPKRQRRKPPAVPNPPCCATGVGQMYYQHDCGHPSVEQDPDDPTKWYCGIHARMMRKRKGGGIAQQAAELNKLLKE
jgi:hypothetical protein